MRTIKSHAAAVRYAVKDAISSAYYTGPIGDKTLVSLRTQVIKDTPSARASVVCFTKAVLLIGLYPLLPESGDYKALRDGVIVCREDQLELVRAYSRHMAERGIIRTVFLESQREIAERYAAVHAQRNRLGLP